eukprot:jgi/Mesvir1/29713/Mv00946-RA.1
MAEPSPTMLSGLLRQHDAASVKTVVEALLLSLHAGTDPAKAASRLKEQLGNELGPCLLTFLEDASGRQCTMSQALNELSQHCPDPLDPRACAVLAGAVAAHGRVIRARSAHVSTASASLTTTGPLFTHSPLITNKVDAQGLVDPGKGRTFASPDRLLQQQGAAHLAGSAATPDESTAVHDGSEEAVEAQAGKSAVGALPAAQGGVEAGEGGRSSVAGAPITRDPLSSQAGMDAASVRVDAAGGLLDFDWRVVHVLSSSKLAGINAPLLQLHLHLSPPGRPDGGPASVDANDHVFELSKRDLESLIMQLEEVQSHLDPPSVGV